MRSSRFLVLGAALTALATGGCGSTTKPAPITPHQVTVALQGSPPPLASLHAEANRLLAGGESAFRTRLAGLRGFPVVVNKWASWCGPCQSEFPAFQRAGAALGRRVAFVGLNGKADTMSEAGKFLKRFPVSYPSYIDENESIARTLGAAGYDPITVFVNAAGVVKFVHAGPYLNATALERDVKRYLTG